MRQGAEVSVMLEFPEQNSSRTVQQASPLPGLILHSDLVSARRRLKHDFHMKQSVKACKSASYQLALLFAGELTQNLFSPSILARPHSQAPG